MRSSKPSWPDPAPAAARGPADPPVGLGSGSILVFQLRMPEHTFILKPLDYYIQFCILG